MQRVGLYHELVQLSQLHYRIDLAGDDVELRSAALPIRVDIIRLAGHGQCARLVEMAGIAYLRLDGLLCP